MRLIQVADVVLCAAAGSSPKQLFQPLGQQPGHSQSSRHITDHLVQLKNTTTQGFRLIYIRTEI